MRTRPQSATASRCYYVRNSLYVLPVQLLYMTSLLQMKLSLMISSACGLILLAGCAEEAPPVSANQFMQNPRLLEATMVRCARNRSETKYDAECVNARDAVNRLEAASEPERRQQLEAQSERKRQALRRTQEAAAEARRRRLEAQRLREEAEYLGLFEEVPAGDEAGQLNAPNNGQAMPANSSESVPQTGEAARSTDGDIQPQTASDLNSIREELKRRQELPE